MTSALPQQCRLMPGTISLSAAWSNVRISRRDAVKPGGHMIMKKTILSLAAAGAVALGTVAPAHALVWWVVPAIAAGAIGGTAVGATVVHQNDVLAYEPQGAVYVQPTAGCHWARVQTANGMWVRQRICP